MRAEEREDEAAAPRVSEGSEEEGEAVVRRFLDTCAKEQSHALAYDTAWRDVFALQLRKREGAAVEPRAKQVCAGQTAELPVHGIPVPALPADDFYTKGGLPSTPVVIMGQLAAWPCFDPVLPLEEAVLNRDVAVALLPGDSRPISVGVETVNLPLRHVWAAMAGSSEWLTERGLDRGYLCQCPIFDQGGGTEPLAALWPQLPLPAVLVPWAERILNVNCWLNWQHPVRTGLHYDSSHGFLCVARGGKHVILFKPSDAEYLRPAPLYDSSPNHARLDPLVHRIPSEIKPWVVTLGPGSTLFIPEGFWHMVDSDPFTVAVNYWLPGIHHAVLQQPSYHLRALLSHVLRERAVLVAKNTAHEASKRATRPQEAVALLCKFPQQQALCFQVLRGLPVAEQEIVLINLMAKIPGAWEKIVMNMDPLTAEVLLQSWEHGTLPPDFLPTMFEAQPELQSVLIAKRAEFARQNGRLLFQTPEDGQ